MPDQLLKRESPLQRFHLSTGGYLFFYFSTIAFLAVAGVYGGFLLLNRNLQKAEEKLIESVRVKQESLKRDLKSILLFESRLKNTNNLLAEHRMPSRILQFLEKNTLPTVRFTSFSLNGGESKISLVAETINFSILSEQIALLERSTDVERVEFGGLSLVTAGRNRVNFTLSIFFHPDLLHHE